MSGQLGRSVRVELEVKSVEDGNKRNGGNIKEGGWQIPCVLKVYAWASKHPRNLPNIRPLHNF